MSHKLLREIVSNIIFKLSIGLKRKKKSLFLRNLFLMKMYSTNMMELTKKKRTQNSGNSRQEKGKGYPG
jgi:hypothetical protein